MDEQWAEDVADELEALDDASHGVLQPEGVSEAAIEFISSCVLPLSEQLERCRANHQQVTLEHLSKGTPFEWFVQWADGAKRDISDGERMREAVVDYLSMDQNTVAQQTESRHSPSPSPVAKFSRQPELTECNSRVGVSHSITSPKGSMMDHNLSQTVRAIEQLSASPSPEPNYWATDLSPCPESPMQEPELSPVPMFGGPYHGPGKWGLAARTDSRKYEFTTRYTSQVTEIESCRLRQRATSVLANSVLCEEVGLQSVSPLQTPAMRLHPITQKRPSTAPEANSGSSSDLWGDLWGEQGSLGSELTTSKCQLNSLKPAADLPIPTAWPSSSQRTQPKSMLSSIMGNSPNTSSYDLHQTALPPHQAALPSEEHRRNVPKLRQLNGSISPNTPPRKSRLIPRGPQSPEAHAAKAAANRGLSGTVPRAKAAANRGLKGSAAKGAKQAQSSHQRPATSCGTHRRVKGLSLAMHPGALIRRDTSFDAELKSMPSSKTSGKSELNGRKTKLQPQRTREHMLDTDRIGSLISASREAKALLAKKGVMSRDAVTAAIAIGAASGAGVFAAPQEAMPIRPHSTA